MNRTRTDLADRIYRVHGGLSRQECRELVDLIFERIRGALAAGTPVLITGFGSFRVRPRRPRVGRNPRTGEAVRIDAARRAVFRPSRLMVRDLNRRSLRGPDADA